MEDGTKVGPPKSIERVSDFMWELPKSFKEGMQVPGRIVASKKLLDEMDAGVFEQLANVACLPGIQKYAYCMPDGHWGYGFPIGGVAAFDTTEGVISPGGIGFDINCLTPDAKLSIRNGAWKTILDLEKEWANHEFVFFDQKSKTVKHAKALLFLKKKVEEIYQIRTKSGREIKVTKEHPLLSDKGFVEAGNLKEGNVLYISPFSGVEYETPSEEIIISLKEIESALDRLGITHSGNARNQIIHFLQEKNLHQISYNSSKLPILIKLIGFIFGDGSLSYSKKSGGQVGFFGKREDLESIRIDLISLGLGASNVHSRDRKHKINTFYGVVEFDFKEDSLNIGCTSLVVLMVALGTPLGKKPVQGYRVPKWVMKAKLWHKRLFLSTFFGAELSTPKTSNKYNFYSPQLNMNKLESLKENGIEFLNDIRLLLSEFGITSTYPVEVDGNQYLGKHGKTIGLRILIQENPENILKLYETVGFDYNKEKYNLAALASNYIRFKEIEKSKRKEIRNTALQMYQYGKKASAIRSHFSGERVSQHFINHSIWPDRSDDTRVPPGFISFEDFKSNLIGEGIVLDNIDKIEVVPYEGFVYDLTMSDENHSFIAQNIVSHNCGMRLVRTNLTYKEVAPKIKLLVDSLFEKVPVGVGGGSDLKIAKPEFKKMLEQGSSWCVDNGLAWKEDIERTEGHGKIDWADASKVSDRAIARGIDQLGTLGSGNHYLEIQVAHKENIHDKKIAKSFGIDQDEQVVIMLHCGSRGVGHQIATDYLKTFEEAMKKYNLRVNDRELSCAPFSSKEGQDYYKAMACAANMAFTNRQVMMHQIREVFSKVFDRSAEDLGMELVYDVAHNIAKVEKHKIDGSLRELIVHRKGATRAFPPGDKELPSIYKETGQPVIIGGSMETGSYLLAGASTGDETFFSTCHGSGRTMSRTKAKSMVRGDQLQKDMLKHGIYVKTSSMSGLAEEAGFAYKNVTDVVDAVAKAGITKTIAGLSPIGNLKG